MSELNEYLSHLDVTASLHLDLSDYLRLPCLSAERHLLKLVATLLQRNVEHLQGVRGGFYTQPHSPSHSLSFLLPLHLSYSRYFVFTERCSLFGGLKSTSKIELGSQSVSFIKRLVGGYLEVKNCYILD